MTVALGLESLLEDKIAVGMKGNCNMLVSRVCPEWGMTNVICVELAEGVHLDKDLIRWFLHGTWGHGRQIRRWRGLRCFGLG